MRRVALLRLLLVLASLCGATGAAHAQPVGAIQATVTILYPPLTAVGVRPLQFASVVPGTPKAVLPSPTAAGVGELRIAGMRNRRGLVITIALPSVLTRAGGVTMPIDFNGNYAGNCEITNADVCDPVTYVAWNPVASPTFSDTPTRSRPGRPRYTYDEFSVYIGGRVLPAVNQPGGTYLGTISVTLVPN